MDTDLDTLATALYVTCDDLLKAHPERVAPTPAGGFTPRITDAEMVTVAVLQAILGHTSERRWLRYARTHLRTMFPTLPCQSGYNKRLRALAPTMAWLTHTLAAMTGVGDDTVWLADSTPVECGRSRETTLRSDLAGWAEYGYCASHSRFFWGPRLHLPATVHGLPTMPIAIIVDQGYYSRAFETKIADITLIRPTQPCPGRRFLTPLRQII
ncbi:hypothetical protein GCM10023147_03880 [Tsukamurella soli]|uniref:DDE superfamily endonuclease n=1 Tax=Tsukamurella soli TaxID=644556 RepID=A0ABP8J2N3_9ACTN